MSKQTTLINRAYMRYARSYELWHEECQHFPITVRAPRILYLPGIGYEINGRIHRDKAEQIIASLNAETKECMRLIEQNCKPTAPSVYERFGNVEPIEEAYLREELSLESEPEV